MWPLQTFCAIVLFTGACASKVCYNNVGCFSNDPPFDNAMGYLPLHPSHMPLNIYVYTRQNRLSIQYNDPFVVQELRNAQVDLKKPTKFIFHGFGGNNESALFTFEMKDALLTKGDFNVFVVMWEKGAEMPDYYQAVANLRLVAVQIKILLEALQKGGLNPSNVHLIGHSLGGQLSGNIGRLMNGKVGRISGLDPAGPAFEGESTAVRLDKTDAVFVEAIHTDGSEGGQMSIKDAGLGMLQPAGHVDFYVNGGQHQHGCYDDITETFQRWLGIKRGTMVELFACSHFRSCWLFIESINSECEFIGHSCLSYEMFLKGVCRDCSNNRCNMMGFPADPHKAMGVLYLETNAKPPYCVKESKTASTWG